MVSLGEDPYALEKVISAIIQDSVLQYQLGYQLDDNVAPVSRTLLTVYSSYEQ